MKWKEKEGEKIKFKRRIIPIFYILWITVRLTTDERGITKNIQDYSWRREEQGKFMMLSVQTWKENI